MSDETNKPTPEQKNTTTPTPKDQPPKQPQIRQQRVNVAMNILTHQNNIHLTEERGRSLLKDKLNPKEIDLVYEKINKIPPEIMKILRQRKMTSQVTTKEPSSFSRFSEISSYVIKGFNIASLAVISSVGANYLINKSIDKKQNAIIHQRNGQVQEKVNTFNDRLRSLQSDFAVLPARYVGVDQLGQRLREFKNQTQEQITQIKSSVKQDKSSFEEPVKKRQLQLKFTPFSQSKQSQHMQQSQNFNQGDIHKQNLSTSYRGNNQMQYQDEVEGSFISENSHKIVSSVDNLQGQFKKMGEHLLRIAEEIKDSSVSKKGQRIESIQSLLVNQKKKIEQLERVIYKKNNQQSIALKIPYQQSEITGSNLSGGNIQPNNKRLTANLDINQKNEQQMLEDQQNDSQQKFQKLHQQTKSTQNPVTDQFDIDLQQFTNTDGDKITKFPNHQSIPFEQQLQEEEGKQTSGGKGLTTILNEEQNIQISQIRKDEEQKNILNLFIGNFEKDQTRVVAGKALSIPFKSMINNPSFASKCKINPANQSFKVVFENQHARDLLIWLGFETKFSSIYEFTGVEDQWEVYKARMTETLEKLLNE